MKMKKVKKNKKLTIKKRMNSLKNYVFFVKILNVPIFAKATAKELFMKVAERRWRKKELKILMK